LELFFDPFCITHYNGCGVYKSFGFITTTFLSKVDNAIYDIMTTRKTVSLMWETDSYDDQPKRKIWRRVAYSHAISYEDALYKLLPKLSQHWGLPLEDRYFLVWGLSPNYENITDVSKAVVNRLKKNAERSAKRMMKVLEKS
jgi:hypothetical protein